VALDREAIERRDFPLVASGYEPAAVDAHLRALAAELERLGRPADAAHSAGSQIQSVLDAAQHAAAEIEDAARQRAEQAGAHALSDARTHLAAVTRAAQTLLERLAQLDSDIGERIAAATRTSATSATGSAAAASPARQDSGPASAPSAPDEPARAPSPATAAPANGDLDGARLVALNMALSGEPRAATERYLAEHFQLRDRDKLIEEVYAAVDG
jgi:hypothetical protein